MTNCKGCPFLYEYDSCDYFCTLNDNDFHNFHIDGKVYDDNDPISKDCQLELVQYTLKDKSDSITFIPNEHTS